ncbi:MAG: energy-coupling factor ABC transporter ATP-binding protein [Desulfovibrio sp.]
MIELMSVDYEYAGHSPALHGVGLMLPSGGIHLLAGANGSGKSTLLALLAGLLLPTAGTCRVAGYSGESIREVARLVLQDADVQILGATVGEDVMLGRKQQAEVAARRMLDRFAMEEFWDSPVHTLSGGMKQKLGLAAALLDKPKVLLLDEPLSGLDYPAIRELRSILSNNRELGMTQILAVHDLEPVIDLADSLNVLHHGELALQGNPEALLDQVRELGVRPPGTWQAGLGIRPWD